MDGSGQNTGSERKGHQLSFPFFLIEKLKIKNQIDKQTNFFNSISKSLTDST